jgi:hypothetical protein
VADWAAVNQESWPTPQGPSREPLPRVEDLPVAEQGYEQESVKAAFDSFYRHAAQLDAALRTLEAVDSFHRQAAALRADLHTLRTAGWTQQSWQAAPAHGYGGRGPREGISPAVWRIAGEAVFLIVVAVVLGVARLHWWVIVPALALAWLVVGVIEWAAARERFVVARPAPAPAHPVVEAAPSPEAEDEAEAVGWTAFEEAQEPSDAMTIIGASSEPAEAKPASEPEPVVEAAAAEVEAEEEAGEPEPVVESVSAAAEAEPEAEAAPRPEAPARSEPQPDAESSTAGPRRRWWQRGAEEDEPSPVEPAADPPRNVRVLPPEEQADVIDPWERGFDTDEFKPEADTDRTAEAEAPEGPGADEDTDERLNAVASETDKPRGRFRRR